MFHGKMMSDCFLYMALFKECIQGSMLSVDTLTKPQKPTPTSNKSQPDQSHSNSPRETILSRVVLTTIQVAYVYSNVYNL